MDNFKAGEFVKDQDFRSFMPSFLCKNWQVRDIAIINMLTEASALLAGLEMRSKFISEKFDAKNAFIKNLKLCESFSSSGNCCTESDFKNFYANEKSASSTAGIAAAQNYFDALDFSLERLGYLPLDLRMLRNAHGRILQNLQGAQGGGQFRKENLWMGGISIADALYIAPSPDNLQPLLADFEKFIAREDALPALLKLAIISYQFGHIQPFAECNSAASNILTALFLTEKKILTPPILNLGSFFARNAAIYKEKLDYARINNDMSSWVKFFLVSLVESAKLGLKKLENFAELEAELEKKLAPLGKRRHLARQVLKDLFDTPALNAETLEKKFKISRATAYNVLKDFQKQNILSKHGKNYLFTAYITLLAT